MSGEDYQPSSATKEKKKEERQYLDLINLILEKGVNRKDRTGTGTRSIFCPPVMRFSLKENRVPLITTKRVPWKVVIKELLWFLRGETDAKILSDDNVHIWDGNTSRDFLDKRGLTAYREGLIGPGYGHQWRHFGGEWDETKTPNSNGGIDQITEVIHLLKTDPFSRRLVVSAWNPTETEKMALPPCHNYFEFYVTPAKERNSLSLHYHMRSNDVFLGAPFNIFSYAVLLRIIAAKVNMCSNELVVTLGDAHLYANHIEQAKRQLLRDPLDFPTMEMSSDVTDLPFEKISVEHFSIANYSPHAAIVAHMAV